MQHHLSLPDSILAHTPQDSVIGERRPWALRESRSWSHISRYWEMHTGLIATALGFCLLAGIARQEIPSQYVVKVPYCEAAQDGFFAQPVNTLSNLSYSLVGLVILYMIGHDRRDGRRPAGAFLSQLFGWIAILLGFTSAAFHGTLSRWGGISDNIAMNLLVSLVLVYNLVHLLGGTTRVFGLLYAAFNTSTTAYLIHDDSMSLHLFAGIVGAAVLSEGIVLAPLWIHWVRSRVRRSPEYLGYALTSFAVGWGLWHLSNTAGPLCAPGSVLQGHAAWHLLTALSILFLCLYFRSECPKADGAIPDGALRDTTSVRRA